MYKTLKRLKTLFKSSLSKLLVSCFKGTWLATFIQTSLRYCENHETQPLRSETGMWCFHLCSYMPIIYDFFSRNRHITLILTDFNAWSFTNITKMFRIAKFHFTSLNKSIKSPSSFNLFISILCYISRMLNFSTNQLSFQRAFLHLLSAKTWWDKKENCVCIVAMSISSIF